ncbi:hypothetical protein SR1949_41230 [Sphaerospermopsis reniformis]|uniref:Uncharacterized protein n=1 Tax=Sphaerospermopsis reniformis TaxID=531300 RepID=A0A480A3D4_9CYAN|nr:hypothetical protein SR1949_41230 [Sphaerospermopsis reniformis]
MNTETNQPKNNKIPPIFCQIAATEGVDLIFLADKQTANKPQILIAKPNCVTLTPATKMARNNNPNKP